MNADVAKCSGRTLNELCSRRDECERFVSDPAPRQTWTMPIVVGWLCDQFLPTRASQQQHDAEPR